MRSCPRDRCEKNRHPSLEAPGRPGLPLRHSAYHRPSIALCCFTCEPRAHVHALLSFDQIHRFAMSRLIAFFSFCTFFAQADPVLIVTETNLAQRIHAQNPDLIAARWKIEEARGQWQQAGRGSRPQLDVQWSHDSRFREGEIKLGVSRSFPVTNRLFWEKEISKSLLEAAEIEVARREKEIIAEAKTLLIQTTALQQRQRWLARDARDADQFATNLQAQQLRAETSALDAAQAKIDAARLTIEQKQLDARAASLHAELKKLLGMPITAQITVDDKLPPMQVVDAGTAKSRADYQQALRYVDAARHQVEHELANRYDNMNSGVFLNGMSQRDAPIGYNRDVMLGFQFSIPLPFGNDNSGNIATAKASVERRTQEAQSILTKAQHDAQGALAEMQEWQKLVTQIRSELLPLADEQLQLAQQAHAQGQGDLAAIFLARSQKRQLHLNLIDATSSYHLARIRHQAALGQP